MAAVRFDAIRTLSSGSITASYAAIGIAMAFNMRMIKIVNNTDGDMFISFDGTTNNDFLPAGGYVIYDFSTNAPNITSTDSFVLSLGTVLYAKYSTAPTTGAVWVTAIYAKGG